MTSRRVATTAWVLSVLLCVAGGVFGFVRHDPSGAGTALVSLVFPTVGVVVARHVPRHPIGWSLLLGGLCGGFGTLGLELAPVAAAHAWPAVITHTAAWLNAWTWVPGLASALVFTALWFPDGQVALRWLRPVPAVALAGVAGWCLTVAPAAWMTPTRELLDNTAPAPTGFRAVLWAIGLGGAAVLLVAAVLATVGLIVRWRHADGLARVQLKWVWSGMSAVGAFLVLSAVVPLGAWQNTLGMLSLDVLAVAIGVSVLRYRLYEIDKVVSRTVSYAVVVALLAAVYVAILTGLASLVPDRYGQFGVAAGTLVVSVLAVPLTRRVRHTVDRRFNRSRFDAEELAARFAALLRRDPTYGSDGAHLLQAVEVSVQPAHASLWLLHP